ncbi:hypothetical protein TrLO_g6341 [Triparma laevis f. longispina]|uniref:Transcriptional adapter 2-alpha/beta-like domain-containing protein n=1 Tax=Triparma laevis f. longispina TaxID=1714387 RepID=A0A9W7CF63_9STRA|nr:hypothetical protein TrLO_g6341 [Triparma laevis f. longispina]
MEHYLDVYLERHGYVFPEKYHDNSPTLAPPIGLVGLGNAVGSSTNRDFKIQTSLNLFKRIEKATEEGEKEAIREKARRMGLTEPFNVDDIMKMPGYDLTGFMPRRREFDVEWEQDAEVLVGDMEFLPKDTKEEREMKKFTQGLLQAAKMREEIARLKVCQQMGFTTEAQVKAYEEAKKQRLKALNGKRGGGGPKGLTPVVVNVKGTTVGADPLDDPNMKHYNKKIGRTAEEAEASLCLKLSLPPPLFLKLKTALISEAVSKGFVNSHTVGKIGRVKVNVTEEQEKQVFEFCLTAGWINTN